VRADRVEKLERASSDVMAFIVSGGVAGIAGAGEPPAPRTAPLPESASR
jgi:ABC-type uncharacterized transport system permease subunit